MAMDIVLTAMDTATESIINIKENNCMKIKSGFVVRKIANQYMAVPVGARAKELHGMIGLNETAAFLWELLKEERTEEELVQELLKEYEVEEEQANQSVKRFHGLLIKEGVLADE